MPMVVAARHSVVDDAALCGLWRDARQPTTQHSGRVLGHGIGCEIRSRE